jgi:hypothetical protein
MSCYKQRLLSFSSFRSIASPSNPGTMATAAKNTESKTTVQKLSINAEDVREVVELEHTLTFREALSLYPKAIGWSFYFSLGVIMLGTIMAGSAMFAPLLMN